MGVHRGLYGGGTVNGRTERLQGKQGHNEGLQDRRVYRGAAEYEAQQHREGWEETGEKEGKRRCGWHRRATGGRAALRGLAGVVEGGTQGLRIGRGHISGLHRAGGHKEVMQGRGGTH